MGRGSLRCMLLAATVAAAVGGPAAIASGAPGSPTADRATVAGPRVGLRGVHDRPAIEASPSHIVHWFGIWYFDQAPLRYGTLKYGYRHIRFRRGYNAGTQRSIQSVLFGYNAWERQGNTLVFFQYRGKYEYVVVVGVNTVPGELGFAGKGVITYYRQRRQDDRRRRPRPPCADPSECPCPPSPA